MKNRLLHRIGDKIVRHIYTSDYAKEVYNVVSYNSGLAYFVEHVMPTEFDLNAYKDKANPFYLKYGIRTSQAEGAFYGQCNGIKSDLYLTRDIAFQYVYPCLNRYQFIPAYTDKAIQPVFAHLFDSKDVVKTPMVVAMNSNGQFYGVDVAHQISRAQAITQVLDFDKDVIIKPTLGTYGGEGVKRLSREGHGWSRSELERIFDEYGTNFIIQEAIRQHETMASFNETSVNTVRIATYRDFSGRLKVLYSAVRFGGKGATHDNISGGGGAIAINDDGSLRGREFFTYKSMTPHLLPSSAGAEGVPCYERVKSVALALHSRLPHYNYMAWDIAIDPDGNLVLIEFNIRSGLGLQLACGPFFDREDLEEIMEHVSKMNVQWSLQPSLTYPNRAKKTWPCDAY